MTWSLDAPVAVSSNAIPRFYRGGARIAAFRHPAEAAGPEDWIASTTAAWGEPERGLSRMQDGRFLRDVVRADPEALLGAAHVARFGSDPALLVKLLDAGERLAVHVHPDDAFAARHLGLSYGKTEAWVILATEAPAATVHLGFREAVDAATLLRWVEEQDVPAMLGALNPVSVAAGDALLVPAGTPHAIGPGILLLELQQPTDLSIMLETAGVDDPFLGLDPGVALAAVDRSARHTQHLRGGDGDGDARTLLPSAADPFFRAERIASAGGVRLDAGFSILVVLEGHASLSGTGGAIALHAGTTAVIPHAAGAVTIAGELLAIRCRPPA